AAAAFASSTVTPRASPETGSRVAQNVDAAGPTAMATRSEPVGAMSLLVRIDAEMSSAATTAPARGVSRATPAAIFTSDRLIDHMALLRRRSRFALPRASTMRRGVDLHDLFS